MTTAIRRPLPLLLLLVAACGRRTAEQQLDISGLELVNGETESRELGSQVRRLLEAEQWDSLELLGGELRSTDARFSDGGSKLRYFYVEGAGKASSDVQELAWRGQIRQLKAWVAARPGSMTAHVALASGLLAYAWKARGRGWARDVSDSAMALMHERLTEASTALTDARTIPGPCPGWYLAALRIGHVAGMDAPTYDALYTDAVARFPRFDAFAEYKAVHLLPRWGGRPGALEAFATQAADQRGGSDGDELYARIAWYLTESIGVETVLRDHKLSWPRIRAGYTSLLTRYPGNIRLTSQLVELAYEFGDKAEARARFQQLGNKVDVSVFNGRERFAVMREEFKAPPAP